MTQRLEFLKKIALFSDLTSEELELVAKITEEKVIESGKTLFQEDSPRNALFLIIDGEVEIFKTSPFGDEKRLSFFSKYDFLGEGSLMDDSPHSTSARTLLKTTTLTITKEKYDKLTSSHWEIAIKILSRVARVISRRTVGVNILFA